MARSRFLAVVLPLAAGLAACSDKVPVVTTADPGALISVSLDSQVGVLLDEIPMSMRARLVSQLVAAPPQFWLDRATAQARLATYRLTNRAKFYPGQAKQQLALPPESVWTVALRQDANGSTTPTRLTLDGHDVVVVDYALTTTVVTTVDSPGKSEPALGTINGTWVESYTFPIDPQLLVQRTGTACMDESQYPPGSVDSEEAAVFYNQECGVEAQASATGCHQTLPLPALSCRDALFQRVGTINATLNFKRIAWDIATADSFRAGPVLTNDAADLRADLPAQQPPRLVYRYVPAASCAASCVGAPGWRQLLLFSTASWNVGGQPLALGTLPASAVQMNTCDSHTYYTKFATASFGTQAQPTALSAFCLQSTNRFSNNEASPLANAYATCAGQGIAAGWGNNYAAGIPCQWLDVTGQDAAGPVSGALTTKLNPGQVLCEGQQAAAGASPACTAVTSYDTTANNTDVTQVTVPALGGSYVTQACTRGQIGPRRDCGFAQQSAMVSCSPGSSVSALCTVSGAGSAPQAVRMCEYSTKLGSGTACDAQHALASAAVDTGAIGATVTFTCPPSRDANEPGGLYAIYTSPLIDGDARAQVTCIPLTIN